MSRLDLFKERISPFIQSKLNKLATDYGKNSWEYNSIAKQYIFNKAEDEITAEHNDRHYDASVGFDNIERLYQKHICCEINFSCAAHCRYCLRQNYEGFVLSDNQINEVVEYVKSHDLEEILITGGDPFLSPKKLRILVDRLIDNCSTLYVIRIATRTFTQNPNLINDELIDVLKKAHQRIRVEVATQISSPIELTWIETKNAFKRVLDLGIQVYSQNVFLKDINDDPEHLIQLYENMRKIGITPHYLFNCIPMKGIHHFRPSLKKMIECYEQLVNSGRVTGRSKPILALMTGIGKITLTPFNVIEYKEGKYIKLRSRYKLEDRLKYNPHYKLPEDAWVDDSGYLCITYIDGND